MVYSTFQVFYVLVDLLSSCSSHYINGILLLTCVVLMICKSQPQFQGLTIWGEDGALVLLSWATSSLLPDKGCALSPPLEKAMATTPVLLPGKSHGQRSLVDCSPWGREQSDMTERLHFHFSLSCTGEGNGNPLHCSCLENPRDGGAWWAAIYGVTQSRTRLK